MSPSDPHPFDSAGFTPELTRAMQDVAEVNTCIIMIDRVERERPALLTDDLRTIREWLRALMPALIVTLNELLERESYLKRGL